MPMAWVLRMEVILAGFLCWVWWSCWALGQSMGCHWPDLGQGPAMAEEEAQSGSLTLSASVLSTFLATEQYHTTQWCLLKPRHQMGEVVAPLMFLALLSASRFLALPPNSLKLSFSPAQHPWFPL
jgi:hypothetical protein